MDNFKTLFYRVNPKNIVRVKFVLESYDGLGILRTLDSDAGLIVILTVESSEEHVCCVMKELEESAELRRIGPLPLEYDVLVGKKNYTKSPRALKQDS